MIAPAARMIRPTRASARVTDCSGVAPVEVLLADPRLQEDVVVHAQAEQDREHEERDEGHDRDVHAGLEDRDDHAVGGADREQVEGRARRAGPRCERKTAISSTMLRPITSAMKIGSRAAILAAMSSSIATAPPT